MLCWQVEGDDIMKSRRSDDSPAEIAMASNEAVAEPEVLEKGRTVTRRPASPAPGAEVNRLLTPPEVARRWRVRHDKVLTWIRSGELRAINVATKPDGRPSYRVDPDDLRAFANRRTVVTSPRQPKRKRRQKQPSKEYF